MNNLKINYGDDTLTYNSDGVQLKFKMIDWIENIVEESCKGRFKAILRNKFWEVNIIKCTVCKKYYIYNGHNDIYLKLDSKPDQTKYVKCDVCRPKYKVEEQCDLNSEIKSVMGVEYDPNIYL
jgi:hypothetical protein